MNDFPIFPTSVIANPVDSDRTNDLLVRIELKRLELEAKGVQPKGIHPKKEDKDANKKALSHS